MPMNGVPLSDALDALSSIAPPELAASWDNVGLLVEPLPAGDPDTPAVRTVLLTIDLTEAVLAEALESRAELVVAYHPPIFGGLKRVTRAVPLQRVVIEAIRNGITVWTPHTAADAAAGGVNDWLAGGLGHLRATSPIEPVVRDGTPLEGVGFGRLVELAEPAPLDEVTERLKRHLSLSHLRLAAAERHKRGALIATAAVCPGAGGSLFEQVGEVDLLVTGELRHHDVLARVAAGSSVVLTDHSNCERGYLPVLAARLSQHLGGGVRAIVSATDRDPLRVL